VPRARGLAVYLTRDAAGVPRALLHGLKHFQAVHERVLLLTVETALLPHVPPSERLHFAELTPGVGRAVVTFGFMDAPRVPPVLESLPEGWRTDAMATSFILGRQILVPSARPRMARWRAALFGTMLRLAGSATEYYDLPPGRVVELGAQVSL
jgi:KUP system potassium uptake protein